jgi:hypothetical protein
MPVFAATAIGIVVLLLPPMWSAHYADYRKLREYPADDRSEMEAKMLLRSLGGMISLQTILLIAIVWLLRR